MQGARQVAGQHGAERPCRTGPALLQRIDGSAKKCATRGTHSNVLQHITGYLKQAISAEDKQEMVHVIGQYRLGIVPLVVPLTLLKHHFRQHPDPYIAQQVYLQPHPENLSLRNLI
ncbi:YbgA family protein [Pseudomonas sp. H22_DOA]|nr:YbgA family protein [Pseudomonas sp. H22_DOA]